MSARRARRSAPAERAAGRVRRWTLPAAVTATALLVAVAVLALVARRRDQRAAVERALARELTNAGAALLDHVRAEERQVGLLLTAPVFGLRAAADASPLRLAEFARFADELLAGLGLGGDPDAGAFRVALRGVPARADALEADGAVVRDGALRSAVLARATACPAEDAPSHRPPGDTGAHLRVGARVVALLLACQRDADGRAVALVGVTYSPRHWAARVVPRLVREVPLLPPSFYGIDWVTAAPAASVPHATDPRVRIERASPRTNAALALEVTTVDGGAVYRTPGGEAAALAGRAGPRIVLEGLAVRVHMPAAHARRLVTAAFPPGVEGWLLGGVAMLGALFVVGTAVELRRQHQLVEERRHFVSTVSHELRTPLAHIVLLSETLLGPAAQTAEQRQRWLTVIRREAVRLGRLVENVLLHTRGELRDVHLDLQPVDVGEVVREVVATMEPAAAARQACLRTVMAPALEVRADAGALRQVLLNLLDNALRYGPEGQTVTLTAAPRAAGTPLVLTVDDEGVGIPPAERRRVWTPFVRLGDRGGVTGGTGLGLSVVRALVHQHGGRVDVGDAPGGGARFVVTLP